MTAERKKALIPIIQGLKRSVGDYPITTAIVDLADYQMAGTIDGALNGVQQDAAVKDAAAASVLDQYRTSAYGPDGNTGRLRAWLYPGFASVSPDGQHFLDRAGNVVGIDAGRRAMLQAKLQQSGLQNIAPTNLLVDPRLAELRASLVRDIPIP